MPSDLGVLSSSCNAEWRDRVRGVFASDETKTHPGFEILRSQNASCHRIVELDGALSKERRQLLIATSHEQRAYLRTADGEDFGRTRSSSFVVM